MDKETFKRDVDRAQMALVGGSVAVNKKADSGALEHVVQH